MELVFTDKDYGEACIRQLDHANVIKQYKSSNIIKLLWLFTYYNVSFNII